MVEHLLPKQGVASSILVSRSKSSNPQLQLQDVIPSLTDLPPLSVLELGITCSGATHSTMFASSALELIGNTPMVQVHGIDAGPCTLFLKLESQNPAGSIKDRIALSMIAAAEASGELTPGRRIVEATAGNTGLGLALVAGQRGYPLTLVIPDKMSREKILHLKALGSEVILTRSDVGKGHPEYYQDMARRIADETGAYYINQFENPSNPAAHEKTTGPEIWDQLDHDVDAIVCGVGSGGTLTGVGRFLRSVNPDIEIVLADPAGSILAPLVNDGIKVQAGSWLVEGIGEDFVPKNCDLSLVTHAYSITDRESIATVHDVLRSEGVICGSSSGTLIAAALRYCREQKGPKRVATFVCDNGNKYLSKIYNDYWLDEQGMTLREQTGDLRDLIGRPFLQHDAILVKPSDTLQTAYGKMKLHDVSQLPVMIGSKLVGIIAESDILLAVTQSVAHFDSLVEGAMARALTTVDVASPTKALLPIFERGMVAIVTEDDHFIGLITQIDFLQHLRRKVGHLS